MTRRVCIAVVLFYSPWLTPCLAGEPDAPDSNAIFENARATPKQERNAAVAYQRAWLGVVDQLPTLRTDEARHEFVATDRAQAFIADVLYASELEGCDFEVRSELGIDATLPHLQPAARTGDVLFSDAERLAEQGDTDAAVDRIGAAIRLARHLTTDATFVSSMTAGRLVTGARDTLRSIAAGDPIDQAARARLLDALARFEGPDPFATRAAVIATVEIGLANSATTILAGEREQFGGFDTFRAPEDNDIKNSHHRRAERALAEARPWVRDVLEAWDSADPLPRLRAIDRAATQREYGELGEIGLFSVTRVRRDESEWTQALKDMHEAVRVQG